MPVKLDDNGRFFSSKLVAGLVGSEIKSSQDKSLSASGVSDTLSPVPGWWMFVREGSPTGEKQGERDSSDFDPRASST